MCESQEAKVISVYTFCPVAASEDGRASSVNIRFLTCVLLTAGVKSDGTQIPSASFKRRMWQSYFKMTIFRGHLTGLVRRTCDSYYSQDREFKPHRGRGAYLKFF